MKILIKDTHIGLSDFSLYEEKIICDSLTFKDMSNAMSSRGFDSKKVKKVCFASKKKGFLIIRSGFLQELLLFCKKEGIKIEEIKDDRTKFPFQGKFEYEEIAKDFDPKFDYIDHQVKAVRAMLKANTGICKLPTSSGKSYILSIFLKRAVGVRSLILVEGVSLSIQLANDLRNDGHDVGICNGKGKKDGYHMVSTVGSVKKIGLEKFNCVVVDECHSSAAKGYQDFFEKTSFPLRYGLSATPEGNDSFRFAKIRQYLGGIITETKATELLDNNVITPPEIIFKKIECKPTLDWQSAYDKNIVHNKQRNNLVRSLALDSGVPTLILYKIIEHGEILKELIPEATLLSGENSIKERQDAIDKFKSGEIRILIASNIFKQGISINNIQFFINASGGKSKIEVLQKIGRSLRKFEGKKKVPVIDFMDEGNSFTYKHSLQRLGLYKNAGFTDITIE